MAKKDHLPEFASDWHQEAHTEAVARELAGAERRVHELKEANAHPDVIAEAEVAVNTVRAELKRLGGQKSTRPRSGKETR